jgi:hypothetical protein
MLRSTLIKLTLPYLSQFYKSKLKPLKKVKNKKMYFGTFKCSSKQSETTFFALTQSKKLLPAYSAHTH